MLFEVLYSRMQKRRYQISGDEIDEVKSMRKYDDILLKSISRTKVVRIRSKRFIKHIAIAVYVIFFLQESTSS